MMALDIRPWASTTKPMPQLVLEAQIVEPLLFGSCLLHALPRRPEARALAPLSTGEDEAAMLARKRFGMRLFACEVREEPAATATRTPRQEVSRRG